MGMMPLGGGSASGWITWELARQQLDMVHRMMGGGFQFNYNERTKILELSPDPIKQGIRGWIVMGCRTIRPSSQLVGEVFVKKYALAVSKVTLGVIRHKIKDTTLLGGGHIDTTVHAEGLQEMDKLEQELSSSEGGCLNFFMM